MTGLARELGVFVCMGSILEAIPGDPRRYNTSCMLDPSGTIVARYRKIHLFDVEPTGPGGRAGVRDAVGR